MKITIINYGAGNIKSIRSAVERLGYKAELSSDSTTIQSSDRVIFPGVGQAGFAMKKLENSGLDLLLPKLKQPVLGICLGMQLMCKTTEENKTKGLGIFDTEVIRFPDTLKVPHIGWNTLYDTNSVLFDTLSNHSYMYFVHSYYVPLNKNSVGKTSYGIEYSSALQKDNFYGVQFHPEKSGDLGFRIIENFIKKTI